MSFCFCFESILSGFLFVFLLCCFVFWARLPMYNLIIIPLCMLVLQLGNVCPLPFGLVSLLILTSTCCCILHFNLQFLNVAPLALRALNYHRLAGGLDDRGSILLRLDMWPMHIARIGQRLQRLWRVLRQMMSRSQMLLLLLMCGRLSVGRSLWRLLLHVVGRCGWWQLIGCGQQHGRPAVRRMLRQH